LGRRQRERPGEAGHVPGVVVEQFVGDTHRASCVTRDEPTLSILYAGLVGNATPDPPPARQQRGRLPPRGRSTPVPEGRVTTKGKLTTLSGPIEPPDRFAVTGGRTAVERR